MSERSSIHPHKSWKRVGPRKTGRPPFSSSRTRIIHPVEPLFLGRRLSPHGGGGGGVLRRMSLARTDPGRALAFRFTSLCHVTPYTVRRSFDPRGMGPLDRVGGATRHRDDGTIPQWEAYTDDDRTHGGESPCCKAVTRVTPHHSQIRSTCD